MKRVITASILICAFLTSCSKNNADIPTKETTVGTESTASEMPASTSSNPTTDEMTILGTWEDIAATKQRAQGVSNEEFSKFTDEERESYFEEFGTAVVNGDSMIFSVDIPELKRINPVTETTVNAPASWVDVYSAILSGDNELDIDFYNYDLNINGSENRRYNGCGLYDLDKDGTPELYVAIGMWEGSFYHIFTYKDGKGVYVGQIYARFIEKSTGILFNVTETGYTPDIAYRYTQGGITEIPNYVQLLYETDDEVTKLKIKLGNTIYDYSFDNNLYIVSIYDNLEWAVTNQEIDNQ